MTAQLRSTNISLLLDYWPQPREYTGLSDLWQTFRRTAVEPGQAPDLISFADECLLCAQIAINVPTPTGIVEEGNDAVRSTHTRGYIPNPPPAFSTERSPLPVHEDQHAGLIYLHAGPANLPAGEANIGVIMKQGARRRGYAREAVQLVLDWAFGELKFHRVQAAILDTAFRDRALRLFIGSGFTHEGTKRRAVYQPEGEGMAGVWTDVTHLAMLDTEWMLRSVWKRSNHAQERPAITVWDEMFARHARELEELLKWEEKYERTTSSSTDTLRESIRIAAPDLAYLTDDASSIGQPSRDGSLPPSPRPNVVVTWDEDSEMEDIPGFDELRQQWGGVARRHRQDTGSASPQPSPLRRMLYLPSIPSIRLSEDNPQSPVTIPSPCTPGSTPSASPSPSPAPSIHTSWMESEDEDNWLPNRPLSPPSLPIQRATPHSRCPRVAPAGIESRSRSNSATSSSGSTDSWSDAQSSFGASSGTWDVISAPSNHSPRVISLRD